MNVYTGRRLWDTNSHLVSVLIMVIKNIKTNKKWILNAKNNIPPSLMIICFGSALDEWPKE